MFVLSANGDMLSAEDFDDDRSVISFENAEDTESRCAACCAAVSQETDGYADESGSLTCPAYAPADDPHHDGVRGPDLGEGPHHPQWVPLAWANSAAIETDPEHDSITVTISVGDPRGAFAFTVCRVPDDAPTNAGQLFLHTPYPGECAPHVSLTEVHAGTYRVG